MKNSLQSRLQCKLENSKGKGLQTYILYPILLVSFILFMVLKFAGKVFTINKSKHL